ncbi:MAG: transcription termination/antitermination protein NusG [Candidatus Margulisiibacteriota bacterium]
MEENNDGAGEEELAPSEVLSDPERAKRVEGEPKDEAEGQKPVDAHPSVEEPEAQAEELKTEEPKAEAVPPKWYIVQTLTGMEDRAKAKIENEIEVRNWNGKVFRVLVPEEETVEIKGDKRVVRKRKMYPGYVFVEMLMDEEVWFEIRQTQGVARFIGGKTHPVPVTEREMQRVLKQIGIKEKEVTVEFEMGEAIRIISGSFRGYTGSVSEINAGKSKLKVMINIFGRDTSVEVDFDRVEKII